MTGAGPCDCDGEKVCGAHARKADLMHTAQMEALGRGTAQGHYCIYYSDGCEICGKPQGSKPSPIPTIDRVVGRTRQEVEGQIAALLKSRETMMRYMKVKYAEEDWHGVQDAGSDLRDIDAELVGLRWVLNA